MKTIYSLQELEAALKNKEIAVVYFSNDSCNVCKILKPKISEIISLKYPNTDLIYIDTEKSPLISGQYRVFTIPTIDIYVQGKEHVRFSRNVSLFDFEKAIKKPYDLIFSE